MSADNRFPHPFSKLAANYRVLRRNLPIQVSAIAAQEFKENFTRQGYRGNTGTVNWKKRKYTKRDSGRAILILSGRLKRGIRIAPQFDYARVINNVPYAAAHNEGFKGTVNVKSFTRNRYKTSVAKGKASKRSTRISFVKNKISNHIVKAHRRKIDLVARPFMITTDPLLEDIEKFTFKQLEVIFKKS